MRSHSSNGNSSPLTPGFTAVLEALLEAFHDATQRRCSIWDRAVPVHRLQSLGATDADLRRLVRDGHIEHGIACRSREKKRRSFRRTNRLEFTANTHFVLTAEGIAQAQRISGNGNGHMVNGIAQPNRKIGKSVPHWDMVQRKLSIGGMVVKHHRQPAESQEWILSAFEEQRWPERIDDPLPRKPGMAPKRHLRYTVCNLNRNQINPLIWFYCDGTGTGVLWEPR